MWKIATVVMCLVALGCEKQSEPLLSRVTFYAIPESVSEWNTRESLPSTNEDKGVEDNVVVHWKLIAGDRLEGVGMWRQPGGWWCTQEFFLPVGRYRVWLERDFMECTAGGPRVVDLYSVEQEVILKWKSER